MSQATVQRFMLIDILRGLAALAVLVWHYQHFYYQSLTFSVLTSRDIQPFYSFLKPLYERGLWAVELFWVISGFVFFAVYRAENLKINGLHFFVRRFSRLYPLHFITLVAVGLLQLWSTMLLGEQQIYGNNDWYHFFLNIFLASNWGLEKGFSFNAPIWSVSVEEVVYVVFFFYCRFLVLNMRNTLLMLTISVVAYTLKPHMILLCATLFFTGGVVFQVWSWLQKYPPRVSVVLGFIGFSSALLVYLYCFDLSSPSSKKFIMATIFPTLVFLCASLDGIVPKDIVSRFVWVGDITYSTYLLHIPVQIAALIIFKYYNISLDIANNEWFFVGFFALVILFSLLSYHLVERPAQGYLRKKLINAANDFNPLSADPRGLPNRLLTFVFSRGRP